MLVLAIASVTFGRSGEAVDPAASALCKEPAFDRIGDFG
jgi:hypothetical protein